MKLSIVIPVYNVRAYLERCVASVVRECADISHEVLLVDDGSTDGCGKLCDDIGDKTLNVIVLHKPNGGLSDARNYGTERATGDYVFYLDSDDYLADGGLKALVEAAKQSGSDVVAGNFYYQYFDNATLFDTEQYGTATFSGGEKALTALVEGKRYQNFAWGKLLRRELALQHPFPKGRLFEDTYWFHHILHKANSITAIDKPVVHYVQRDGSISFSYSVKSLDILDGYAERLCFFDEHYPMLVDAHKALMVGICIGQAWLVCRNLSKADKSNAVAKLRKCIQECHLQDCQLINGKQHCHLNVIMRSMTVYQLMVITEKVLSRLGIR